MGGVPEGWLDAIAAAAAAGGVGAHVGAPGGGGAARASPGGGRPGSRGRGVMMTGGAVILQGQVRGYVVQGRVRRCLVQGRVRRCALGPAAVCL
jgi:hypothetical protein